MKPPAIIGVYLAGLNISHAVAFIGWENEKAVIVEPMSGRQMLTASALRDWWNGDGILIRRSEH